MTSEHLKWITKGRKWTALRSLKYDKFPFEKEKVCVNKFGFREARRRDVNEPLLNWQMTYKNVKSEGYETFEELETAIKKMRHKLPKYFWLYDLRKPII